MAKQGGAERGGWLGELEALVAALGWEPAAGLQMVDGPGLARRHHPDVDPARPALVLGLDGHDLRVEAVRCLRNQYPGDHPLRLVRARASDGDGGWELVPTTVGQLVDTARGQEERKGGAWMLAVPPLPFPGSMLDLAEVIAHLRAPDGCPWDRAQTHRSLRPYLLEEAYEAVEAIDGADMAVFAEELGDVLLQVVLHAQVAVEAGSFALPDVIRAITEKLVRRHPHVFGEVEAETPEAVVTNWEQLKKAEKREKGHSESPFSGIPAALPALARADAALKKAAREDRTRDLVPECPQGAFQAALAEAIDAAGEGDEAARDEAFGRALLALVQQARELGVDAETVLRERVTRLIAEAELGLG